MSEACVQTSKGPEMVAVTGALFCDFPSERESFPEIYSANQAWSPLKWFVENLKIYKLTPFLMNVRV